MARLPVRCKPLAAIFAASFAGSLTPAAAERLSPRTMHASGQAYAVTAIPFPSSIEIRSIAGINAKGELAGTADEVKTSYSDCVYFNGSALVDLNLYSANDCSLSGLNASGLAVGNYLDFSGYLRSGVVYPGQGYYFQQISDPVDGFLAVNDADWAIANLPAGGFAVYDLKAGKIVFDLYDAKNACAMESPDVINDHGVVIGYDRCENQRIRYETVTKGVFDYLRLPSGYDVLAPVVFNNASQIVIHKPGTGHPYLWSTKQQGTPLDLGALAEDPTGKYSATTIGDGIVAGTTDHNFSWVWTVKTGMQNLATLVPPNSYGWIYPEVSDERGDLGCLGNAFGGWLYLKRL